MQRLDEKIWMPISIGAIFHSIRTEETSVLKVILLTSHWLIPIIYSLSYFGMMKSMRLKK